MTELTEGVKHDDDKLRWELLPWDAVEEVVKVLNFGARKYEDRNWEKGIQHSRVYAAAIRHLTRWFSWEDTDEETDLPHLAHATCCCLFLLSYQLRGQYEFDDRPDIRRKHNEPE